MNYATSFYIGKRRISGKDPTYFIADIGANHDGNLTRAKDLIKLAKDSGADCAKFQHFQASKIVSAVGFDGFKTAHQRGWDKSVFEVYEDYSINPDWNEVLAETAQSVGIDFMTTPYDTQSAAATRHLVKAFKIGSGDITYTELIRYIAALRWPTFLATGASTMEEVEAAVETYLEYNRELCLMQCNTNYTGDWENFRHVNLRVLQTYAARWPDLPLGLSDHTHGQSTVLGAVALGCRCIEKHFTDDDTRKGPDHSFAMMPVNWKWMVTQVRELEEALGDGIKRVEDNEIESRVVQRRALRLRSSFGEGALVTASALEALRPCPGEALTPADMDRVVGKRLTRAKQAGQEIYPQDFK